MKKVIPEGIEYIDAPLRISDFRKRIDPETKRFNINIAIPFDEIASVDPLEYEPLVDHIEEYLVHTSAGIFSDIILRVVGAIVDDDHSGYIIIEVNADASDWLFEYES